MKSKNLTTASLLTIPLLAATACGQISHKTKSQTSSALGYERMTISAFVINESQNPVDVVFLNNGPHSGGCDSKSYVAYKADSKKTSTLSESWECSEEQWFYIEVKHPIASVKVKGMSARVICNDATGCRTINVQ